ncbi:hypothetical protein J6590_073476 [Homalodisca vitripennis]|nr:hypothetical protein J6590_073476 [Homalodisca vitripennis]
MAVVWRCLLFVSLVLTKFVSASVTNAIPQTEDKEAAVDYVPLHQSSPCAPCPAQPSPQGCKKEYLLVNELSSWYEAMAGCKMRGQQLVTINNIEQWNQVQREITLKKPGIRQSQSPSWHAGGIRLTRTHSLTVSVSVFLFGVSVCGEMSEPKLFIS